MLIDDLMPRYDVVERHVIRVRAGPVHVFAAIQRANLTGGPVTRTLLALRAVPAALLLLVRAPASLRTELASRRRAGRRPTRLADLGQHGFYTVAERAPDEIVIGVMGRFWTPRGGVSHAVSAASFGDAPPHGQALAAWNFTVVPMSAQMCELRTETRVLCAPDVRRRFRMYWSVVQPGSGLIRRSMLRAIRREAEQGPHELSGHGA